MKTYQMFPLIAVSVLSFGEAPLTASGITGNVTYTLKTVSNPSADQSDAYAKIRTVMDSAVRYYNTYTTITKKLTIEYNTSVGTADGNFNGNIRFGKNRQYMKGCTAMHEIAHTTGIGTTEKWIKLIKFPDKVYIGSSASQKYKDIKGDAKAVLKGDTMHFWDYGLNYDYEVKSVQDLINHCLVVEEIRKDLYPTAVFAGAEPNSRNAFSISMASDNMFTYRLPIQCFIKIGVYMVSGKKVFDIVEGEMETGDKTIRLNSKSLSHGSYVYRFQAGRYQENHLFTITR
jgi:hypothetical protein